MNWEEFEVFLEKQRTHRQEKYGGGVEPDEEFRKSWFEACQALSDSEGVTLDDFNLSVYATSAAFK